MNVEPSSTLIGLQENPAEIKCSTATLEIFAPKSDLRNQKLHWTYSPTSQIQWIIRDGFNRYVDRYFSIYITFIPYLEPTKISITLNVNDSPVFNSVQYEFCTKKDMDSTL